MVNSILITIKKEIRSILRDKKTLITLLIFPFFIPMMIFLYGYMYDGTSEEREYLIGINYDSRYHRNCRYPAYCWRSGSIHHQS